MSDVFEIEITARDAKGETATYHAEYTPVDDSHIDCAVNEIVKSLDPKTASRIRTVSHSD